MYDIFSTGKNQAESETNVVLAYEKAKRNIERQTSKVENANGEGGTNE